MKAAADFYGLSAPGFANVNELGAVRDRLHPSESLFGSHNADILLLAQDAAHFEKFENRWHSVGPDCFCHDPKVPTNKMLYECLKQYTDTDLKSRTPNRVGRLFYANAIWLLKRGPYMQSKMVNDRIALEASRPVPEATIEGLTRLRLIITLGEVAYRALQTIDPSIALNWKRAVTSSSVQTASMFSKRLKVGAVYHPGAWGRQARYKAWIEAANQPSPISSIFKTDFERLFAAAEIPSHS